MNKNVVLSFIVGLLASVGVSVAFVTLFSLIVTATGLDGWFITFINYAVKLFSLFLGVFIFVSEGKGLLKGVIFGLSYYILSTFVFFLISGGYSFGIKTVIDVVYCAVVGSIVGILSANVRRN